MATVGEYSQTWK